MGTIDILSPVIELEEQKETTSDLNLETLEGKVVGLMNNGWPSLSIILPRLQELLRTRCNVADARLFDHAGDVKTRGEAVRRMIEECDAVVVALGN